MELAFIWKQLVFRILTRAIPKIAETIVQAEYIKNEYNTHLPMTRFHKGLLSD